MPPISNDQRSRVVSLLKAGELDRNQIAEKVGVSPQTVSAIKAHLTMHTYDDEPSSRRATFTSGGVTLKRGPECNRTYADETISFCLADGALLSAPYDPNTTQILPSAINPDEGWPVKSKLSARAYPEDKETIVYLNNCNSRDHARMFGEGAFYDLDIVGYQATKAKNLKVGQQCVVATPENNGQIVFTWYSFLSEAVKPDDTGTRCRVLFGKFISSETFSKMEAAHVEPYSRFFDKNGNFKRQSVIEV